MNFVSLQLGCQFTPFYFAIGAVGSLIAVLVLPGCYTTLPSIRKVKGEWQIRWAVGARLFAGGVAGCIADHNGVNALFAGFFCWHLFKWLSEEGWKSLQGRLQAFVDAMFRTK